MPQASSQLHYSPSCENIAFSTKGETPIAQGEMGVVFRKDSKVYKIPKEGHAAQVSFDEEVDLFINFLKDRKYKDVEELLIPYLLPTKKVVIEHNGELVIGLQKQFIDGPTLSEAFADGRYYEIKPSLTQLIDNVDQLAKAGYILKDFHENNIIWDGANLKIIDGGLSPVINKTLAENIFHDTCRVIRWCRRVLHSEGTEIAR
jgi:hypothetical protein